MTNISTIVIGKDCSDTLEYCIDSINRADDIRQERFPGEMEILYVDSDSSDDSVEIATRLGCKVIRIYGEHLSASAGRYWGVNFASGDYYQFVDSDMVLDGNWFADALASVSPCTIGKRVEVKMMEDRCEFSSFDFYGYRHMEKVDRIGGFFLIDSRYMTNCNFNPYLKMEEEGDLLGRLMDKEGFFSICNSRSGFTHLNYRYSKKGLLRNYFRLDFRNDLLVVMINSIINRRFYSILSVQKDYALVILMTLIVWVSLFIPFFSALIIGVLALVLVRGKMKSFIVNFLFLPLKVVSLISCFKNKSIFAEFENEIYQVKGTVFSRRFR